METEAERGVAVGGEIGEAVDEGEEGAQIGVEPVDGFEELIMLVGEVAVAPDGFVVKDAVAQAADEFEAGGEGFAGAEVTGEGREDAVNAFVLEQGSPEVAFVAGVAEAAPEAKGEGGDQLAAVGGVFAFGLEFLLGLEDRGAFAG